MTTFRNSNLESVGTAARQMMNTESCAAKQNANVIVTTEENAVTRHGHLLSWELYGPHTAVVLHADLNEDGYRLTLQRDGEAVYGLTPMDRHVLLRISSALRSHFQRAGYRVRPLPDRAPVLVGGPCWGPAVPLQASVFSILHEVLWNERMGVDARHDAA